jgi:predicted dehydrogenase
VSDTASEPALRPVRWGILSTGHIASVFTKDLALLPGEAELTAVGSRSRDKAEAFAAEYGVARAYGSYEELAADPDVEVIYVASTHNDHLPSARLCLEAGKAVLVEKPLTTSAADSEALVELARDRGLFLMEALWTRTQPLLRQGAELVRAGEIGAVRHVAMAFGFPFDGDESHRLLDPDQAGGAILDLGVYPTHLTNLFLGEPDDLVGSGIRGSTGVDVHAAATLVHRDPSSGSGPDDRPTATASLLCTLLAGPPVRLEVFGETGTLTYEHAILPSTMTLQRHGVDEPEEFVTQWPGGGYTFQAQEVMRCLRAGELESPLVPWADTLAVARTLDRWLATIPG